MAQAFVCSCKLRGMKGEKVWQTTLEEPLMISESCLMSWLVLVMILLVCCCIECLQKWKKKVLRRNHTYGIIRITTCMGFTQLASRKSANWLGKSSPWWWNIRDFPTHVSWTEETFWMSDSTSSRHQRKNLISKFSLDDREPSRTYLKDPCRTVRSRRL